MVLGVTPRRHNEPVPFDVDVRERGSSRCVTQTIGRRREGELVMGEHDLDEELDEEDRGSLVDVIEGDGLGFEAIMWFIEYAYALMLRADTAYSVVSELGSLVLDGSGLGVRPTETARQWTRVEKGRDLVDAMEHESRQAAALVPAHMDAAAFDASLARFSEHWGELDRYEGRLERIWVKLAKLVVPPVGRVAGLAIHRSAASGLGWDPISPADPGHGADGATDVGSDIEPDEVLGVTRGLLATVSHRGFPRREHRVVRSLVDTFVVIGGLVASVVARDDMTLMVDVAADQGRSIRIGSIDATSVLVESAGNRERPRTEWLSSSEKGVLAGLGFVPPTRRVAERNWRVVMPRGSMVETTRLVFEVLTEVHHLGRGERLWITTEFDGSA